MWDGVGSEREEEEDAPEWRGFQDEVDFLLGAIKQLTEREREAPNTINIKMIEKGGTYAWRVHEHVTCNVKNVMGST